MAHSMQTRKCSTQKVVLAAIAALAMPVLALSSPAVPGTLTVSATSQSVGVEWTLSGDTNHDASSTLEYRRAGDAAWREAMPLIRVDSSVGNSLAGSIMFLEPGTDYDLRLSLVDPDGGNADRTATVTTNPDPATVDVTRTLHVVPGNGGGDGSNANPYQGLMAAWSVADPGDELLLRAGEYGGISDANGRSGSVDRPIVIRAAAGADVVLSYLQIFEQSNLRVEGLTFRYDGSSDTGLYSSLLNAGYDNGFQSMPVDVDNIDVVRNQFEGYKHAVRAGPRTSNWYIADNSITGDKPLGISGTDSFDGEGIELGRGSNHEVAYNSITRVADGISFPSYNCDIYGNDIFDVTDDGIELDYGQANTRIWQNRIHNAGHNGVAFQPQNGAPWYIIRNQIVNVQESIFKFRNGDRFVAAHNTFVNWDNLLDHWSQQLLRGVTRNNLWISVSDGPIWRRGSEATSWRTDLDYDGFDWGSNGAPFDVNGTKFANLSELNAATGQQEHGIEVDADSCFETFNVPGPPPLTTIPPQWMTLRSTCNAVDAGVPLPNINDSFGGAAPDLGAYELGQDNPHYGPRAAGSTMGNRAPVSNAGLDQTGGEGTAISLSGGQSSDPDGDPLTYSWTQISGTTAIIADRNVAATSVTLPLVGATETLQFRLTVTDSSGAAGNDTVDVVVTDLAAPNNPPVADAGADQTGAERAQVTLSAQGSMDPDNDQLSFQWQQSGGPQATLVNANQMTANVTLPDVSARSSLTFMVTVTDTSGAFATDSLVITVDDGDAPAGSDDSSGGGASGFAWLICLIAFGCRRRNQLSRFNLNKI